MGMASIGQNGCRMKFGANELRAESETSELDFVADQKD
jgi:hypothetical protein